RTDQLHSRLRARFSPGYTLTAPPTNDVQINPSTIWRSSLEDPLASLLPQKARQRKRLRSVDRVVDTVSAALERNGQTSKAVTRWFAEMPREEEMLPKDKYTLFDKKEKSYRKSIHKLPKWTRVSQRVNPPGF
ncbi:Ribosomal protein L31 mitochondrial, partial [Penicillium expansum]